MKRLFKWLVRGTAVLLAVLVVAGIALYFWLRTSLPQTEGEIALPGLSAPVSVYRDSNGVPHIFADNGNDAAFALGFVHAQDRLWQMEMQRRLGAGRISEVLGLAGLRFDRLTRTLGLYRLADANFKHLSPNTRRGLEAYTAGVNAYIETHEGAWPVEYYLLRFTPEPWKPADTLVWGRQMSIQLAINWQSELLRLRIAERVGTERLRDLWPDYPANAPITLTRRSDGGLEGTLARLWAALPHEMIGTGASNEWVVDGDHTVTGKPILANDPHLGMSVPGLWYLARIESRDWSARGATVPGTPLVLLGRNRRIAWGFTNSYIDTDDVFRERLDPDDPTRYLTPEGSEPFEVREETIRVRGEDPVTITVRETRHGPVINDILRSPINLSASEGEVLALSAPWLREEDLTAEAIYRLNRAGGWAQFVEAMSYFDSPPQNVAFADTEGNIGFVTTGRIPIRKRDPGPLPAEGWSGEDDWVGFIPFESMPSGLNPVSGQIINANNRIAGDRYRFFLSNEWGDHYRAARIGDLLTVDRPLATEDMTTFQQDIVSYGARAMLPELLTAPAESRRGRAAIALLRDWDGRMDRTRPEPLIFTAWLRELNRRLYADELGDVANDYWSLRIDVPLRILRQRQRWCDDVTTETDESCDAQLVASLEAALDMIAMRQGEDMAAWQWGAEHWTDFRNRVLDFVPLLRDVANLRIPADGGNWTINRAGMNVRSDETPFAMVHGSGYRAIYDLSGGDDSRYIQATGQSGNVFSAHYDDLLRRWRDGQYIRLSVTREALESSGAERLRLLVGGSGD